MSKHGSNSIPPLAAPFPAPNGVFDFSKLAPERCDPSRAETELFGLIVSGNAYIPNDAHGAQIVKSLVCALVRCDCRIVLIDIDGASGLSVFNGCNALAAYTVEHVAEAVAALDALDGECARRHKTANISPKIVTVFSDPNGKAPAELAKKYFELGCSAKCVGMHLVCCSEKLAVGASAVAIDASNVPIATDDDISRTVATFAQNRA